MPVTLVEQTMHSLEIVKEEEIAASIEVVFQTIFHQLDLETKRPERVQCR